MIVFIRKHSTLACCILAAFSAVALPYAAALPAGNTALTNSVLCLITAVCAYFLLRRAAEVLTCRLFAFSLIGGFLLSLFLVVGRSIYLTYHFAFTVAGALKALFTALAFTPLPAAMLCILFDELPRAGARCNGNARALRFDPLAWSPTMLFFAVWAILLLCWLPAYLGFFPGVYGYDMHNQHHQVTAGVYNTFQPLIHTLFYQVFYRLGVAFTGTATGGVAIYTAAQTATLSACLAWGIAYLVRRMKVPTVIACVCVAFYAILPYNAVLAVSSTKDAIYGGLFVCLLVQTFDLCVEPAAFFRSPWRMIRFVLTVLLACLFRNNMIYALCFLAVFLVLGVKEKRLWIIGLAAVSLLAAVSGKVLLSKALGASDGPRIEMLSIPIQQVACVYDRHSGELTTEQRERITAYLPEEALENFDPLLSDHIKDHCNIGDGVPSILGFLGVWTEFLPQYWNDYADQFLTMTLGYWYPDETLHDDVYAGYHEADTEESLGYQYTGFMESINDGVERRSLWPAAERYYNFFAHENGHERIPLLSLLFSPGFYCWMLLIAMLAMLYLKRYRLLWPMMLPLGVWLTLLLGPCLVMRYAYPIMASFPVFLAVCFNNRESVRLIAPEPSAADGKKDGRGAELARFAAAGAFGFVIDYGIMVVMTELLNVHYLVATGVGFTVSVIVNYLLCAYWVFRGANRRSAGVKAAFVITSLIGLGLNELIMFLLVDAVHVNYLIAKLLAVLVVMIWNYVTKRRVLAKKNNKEQRAEENA